jgi:hypothetical protein
MLQDGIATPFLAASLNYIKDVDVGGMAVTYCLRAQYTNGIM